MVRTVAEFMAQAGDDAPTTAERQLVEAVRAGEACVLLPDSTWRVILADLKAGQTPDIDLASKLPVPTDACVVRAALLRLLINDATPDSGKTEGGVWLIGGWVVGELDLSFVSACGFTVLDFCRFTDAPKFQHASFGDLSLNHSHLPGLFAEYMKVEGSVALQSVRATGTVNLNATKIGGELDCNRAMFYGRGGKALTAQDLKSGRSFFLGNIKAIGTVVVAAAKIGGQFACDFSSFDGDGAMALNAQGLETSESLLLSEVKARGTVHVAAAKVGGQLVCEGAMFHGRGGTALNAQGVVTTLDFLLRDVEATGNIQMAGAKIGGQIDCTNAKFDGQGDKALNAQGVITGLDLLLRNVTAIGTVTVAGAKIGGQLDCKRATLRSSDARTDPSPATSIHESQSDDRDWESFALDAHGLISDQLVWRGVTVKGGTVALAAAKVGDVMDDGHWPTGKEALDLDGFVYDRISGSTAPRSAQGRKAWLEAGSVRKDKFRPQPYTQLARVLREMGHAGEARTVGCWRDRRLWDQRRREIKGAPRSEADVAYGGIWRGLWDRLIGLWSFVLRIVAGYGFKPWRAGYSLLVLWAIAAGLAGLVWREGSFAPNSDVILTSAGWQAVLAADCFPPGDAAPGCIRNPARDWSNDPGQGMDWDSFSALGYGIDLVVPVLDLGQTAAWAPSKDRGPAGKTLWWGRWVLQGAGWFVLLIFAAAVTGIMQRERE